MGKKIDRIFSLLPTGLLGELASTLLSGKVKIFIEYFIQSCEVTKKKKLYSFSYEQQCKISNENTSI